MGSRLTKNRTKYPVPAVQRGHGVSILVPDQNGNKYEISNRWGLSSHSCRCPRGKTGIVMYPYDPKNKNTVLVRCEPCYNYDNYRQDTQHEQLLGWYNNIYRGSKNFRFVRGFSQKDDGSLAFNSTSLNTAGSYISTNRELTGIEQHALTKVISEGLGDYEL